jgi:1,4-dihydroxy-6-naphthoate synthase
MSNASTRTIHLGISTCPNDTFAFHALINRTVDWRGLNFEIELLDIQQLNDRLFAGGFDVAKASFHAALLLAESCVVLPSGSALGFGVGPLLLAARPNQQPRDTTQVTLCPGRHTTAMMLFQVFYPHTTRVEQVIFSDIMPRLVDRQADFGVCIHEGRFTWQDQNLSLVEDLGTRWEATTGSPLPLGGIIARRRLGDDVIGRVQAVIRDSIEYAIADRDAALPTMRRHAQEFDDEVLMQHVDLYVNQWTRDLGVAGIAALKRLAEEARKAEIIGQEDELIVFSD